jgi:hypothetical protein
MVADSKNRQIKDAVFTVLFSSVTAYDLLIQYPLCCLMSVAPLVPNSVARPFSISPLTNPARNPGLVRSSDTGDEPSSRMRARQPARLGVIVRLLVKRLVAGVREDNITPPGRRKI